MQHLWNTSQLWPPFIIAPSHTDKTRRTLKTLSDTMAKPLKSNSIRNFFRPTQPSSSLANPPSCSSVGDGVTSEKLESALKPTPVGHWQPKVEYLECDIGDLYPGPRAVTFMGRVANIFDIGKPLITDRSAKGCVKLCVRNNQDAVTVRVSYVDHCPAVRLGSLVTVWTDRSESPFELILGSHLLTLCSLKRRTRKHVKRIRASLHCIVP